MYKEERYVYYVAIVDKDDNSKLKYITSVDSDFSTIHFEKGKPACDFPKNVAEQICESLCLNMVKSIIIEANEYINLVNED